MEPQSDLDMGDSTTPRDCNGEFGEQQFSPEQFASDFAPVQSSHAHPKKVIGKAFFRS
jgi:hypothetical protein